MLALLWPAFIAPPIALEHAPPVLPQPVLAARLLAVPACGWMRCLDSEWNPQAQPAIPAGQLRVDAEALPGGRVQLQLADARHREWMKPEGSKARFGLQYGIEAMDTQATRLKLAVDTGWRLQAYAEDGIAGTGPVLRGRMEWQQALWPNARLSQVTRVETGQRGTYLRNSVQLQWTLRPAWTLDSGLELRRDSDVRSRNQTDANLTLRYAF